MAKLLEDNGSYQIWICEGCHFSWRIYNVGAGLPRPPEIKRP
ncbi:MAG TPA: hypothetical protein ACFYED_09060 [Candidatus Tripitaka californicus]